MYYLKNLVSRQVHQGNPWEFNKLELVPQDAIKDKARRTTWLQFPETDYQCYTLFEGLDPNSRVTTGTSDQDSNPPCKQHGLAVDYDVPISQTTIDEAIARMEIKPNWHETTLSGYCRLVWLFERPLPLASFGFAAYLQKHFSSLLPIDKLAGLDQNALTPTRLFTNGARWRKISDAPVPWVRIQGWLVTVSSKYDWARNERGVSIPMEEVEARLKELAPEKYPRFNEWPGEIKLGAQGPSFWVEGSISPKSAIVRENGFHTFSAHAHKSFFPWEELLGVDWVKNYEQSRLGRAVENIFYDGRNFFVRTPEGMWHDENKDNLINELVVRRGLSRDVAKKKGQSYSEVEEAISHIRTHSRVKGAAPFAFFPNGPIEFNGDRYLNTHTKLVMPPAPGPAEWGPTGGFPWISSFLEGFFDPANQLDYFLSWLHRFYGSCYRRAPLSGQNVFLAGSASVGKTFLNRAVVGRLMGGYSECKEFLLGDDSFNSELFDYGLWCVDDGSIADSGAIHKYFSEMIKRIAANRDMRSNEKYRKASLVGWQGRVFVTCNDDAESIRMIPRLDISIREKIMLWRAAKREWKFFEDEEQKKVLARELPHFARYILDYKIPAHCLHPDPRFGIRHFHEPSLVASANLTTSAFTDILDCWMREHFTVRHAQEDSWTGTALDLRSSILIDPMMADPMKPFTLEKIKRALAGLSTGNLFKVQVIPEGEIRVRYRIFRDTHYPKGSK